MRLDPTGFSAGHVERATVCIAGSGPAGMTLAQSLVAKGVDVLLVEAGGEFWEDSSQELYNGEVLGDSYFDLSTARLRMLGGSSGHWGGVCRPLSQANMQMAPPTGASGWPIRYDALAPYEAAANDILEIPGNFTDTELAPGLYELGFEQSTPVHFGDKYLDLIDRSPLLRVALNSAVMDVAVEGGRIKGAQILSNETRPWRVEADYMVLCLGGIETPRMLRWFNERANRALIANHDLIGRYWMEHLHTQPIHGLIYSDPLLTRIRDERVWFGTAPRNATDSFAGVNFELTHLQRRETFSLVKRMMCVAPRLGNRLTGLLSRDLVCGVIVTAHSEQWPHAENRITLSDQTDRLGVPKTVLNWRRMAADRDLIANRSRALAKGFALTDLGRFMLMSWTGEDAHVPDFSRNGVWHHMGGTRMADHPDDGIVTPDLRVHDLDNLYISGSSVFPTGGDANPTYTIVQLSLRLADHLANRIGL